MTAPSLLKQLMEDDFARLSSPVQRFHRLDGQHELRGWVCVEAPATWLGRLLAWALGSPTQAGEGPIQFKLDARSGREIWTRHFPTRTMTSTLTREGRFLVEQLGAARLTFEVTELNGALVMHLRAMRFFGVSSPQWLLPAVQAQETGAQGQLRFNVGASLPFVGRVVGYAGHLDIPEEDVS